MYCFCRRLWTSSIQYSIISSWRTIWSHLDGLSADCLTQEVWLLVLLVMCLYQGDFTLVKKFIMATVCFNVFEYFILYISCCFVFQLAIWVKRSSWSEYPY